MNGSEKQFEKFVRGIKFDDSPDPEHRDKLEQDLLNALAKQPRQKEQPLNIWRTIMKTKIAKLATAATIILAVVLSVTILNHSASPAWAIEQSIKAMDQYKAVLIEGLQSERTWIENGSLKQRPFKSWAVANEDQTMIEKYRSEVEGFLILTTNGQKTWRYDPNTNTVRVENRPYIASECWCGSGFLEQLKGFHNSGVITSWEETYGKDPVTGKQRAFLTIAWLDKRYNGPRSLWLEFDIENKLLVSLKQWENADCEGPADLVVERIKYFEALPDDLFEFEIPDGAKVVYEREDKGADASAAEKGSEIYVPDWLDSDEPIRRNKVSQKDYPYLVRWLDRHAKPAQEYMVRLFDTYQVVILAEEHNVKEHKDFVIELIPKLYHEAGVRCIGWEFSPFTKNKRLEELINTPNYDEEAVLQFARDCDPDWNSKEHWQIIEAVWKLNKSLKPGSEKMHFVGLPDEVDTEMWIVFETKPKDSPEVQKLLLEEGMKYDTSMAQHVEEEILQKGQKGLVFVGLGHDWTQYQYPPEATFGISFKPMGSRLKGKYGDKVFQVRTQCSADPSFIDRVMKRRNYESIGFNMQGSPFANILVPVYKGAPDVPWSRLACGSIYLGPRASFHKNTSIKGFVTKTMFHKYKKYYEVCFGRSFNSAEDVDKYLQQRRWPRPR